MSLDGHLPTCFPGLSGTTLGTADCSSRDQAGDHQDSTGIFRREARRDNGKLLKGRNWHIPVVPRSRPSPPLTEDTIEKGNSGTCFLRVPIWPFPPIPSTSFYPEFYFFFFDIQSYSHFLTTQGESGTVFLHLTMVPSSRNSGSIITGCSFGSPRSDSSTSPRTLQPWPGGLPPWVLLVLPGF